MFKFKISLLIIFLFISIFFISDNVLADDANKIFLEKIPGLNFSSGNFRGQVNGMLKSYIDWIIETSVVLGSALAVVMIIFGGVKYMTTDSFSGKSEGKEHLTNAIMGLIFLIGGYLIFTQFNPAILNVNFNAEAGGINSIGLGTLAIGNAAAYGGSNGKTYGEDLSGTAKENLDTLKKELQDAGYSDLEIKHFLAQASYETANFKKMEETGYKPERACEIFGRAHPNVCDHPEWTSKQIFDDVYGGRNGNTEPGDGSKYIGRGDFHLTGRRNYTNFEKWHNEHYPQDQQDFVNNPDLVESPTYAARSAIYYWEKNNVGSVATGTDRASVDAVSKKINGGQNGSDDRWEKFQQISDS